MIEVKIWHKSTPNENRDYFMNNDILKSCQFRKKKCISKLTYKWKISVVQSLNLWALVKLLFV